VTRVLIVEDDRKLAAALAEKLDSAQLTVDVAHDGETALDFARTSPYDAIVLDLLLPRVDGLSVCRQLRARGATTPILMLTARDGLADKVAGLDSGADDYLTKPFASDELLARLRALLRRDASRKEGVLRYDELVLDPAAVTARWRDQPLELTAREYRILELLLRRAEQVVSREAIIESVWGFGFSDNSNLVEVYIRRLRRKLAENAAPALIQTLRGAGYRLGAEER
jgi:DNA-binding response OmpR family regulator